MKKNKRKKWTEIEIAKPVVDWLKSEGWTVYSEVRIINSWKVPDIVAIKNETVWIIESKTSYNSKVLEQAYSNKKYADYISIAVPDNEKNIVFSHFRKSHGIGFIQVYESNGLLYCIEKNEPSRNIDLSKKNKDHLISCLRDGQKETLAGSVAGSIVTDYKITISKVKSILREKGPLTIKEIINNIDHHYSNNKSGESTLSKRLQTIESDCFDTFIENGKRKFKLK